ncbi:NADP-dependent phosphogluconate dehydrogenase [Octadecabacter sp. SW4]|uniref:NADP-dependent phosphogluconate dehydrogenase n=1 Tax=Octadecabacter sp. SW4 TaxID=2602067 RepID=UPI0011C1D23F|nr:NADP-dependent phosphogluconate dehydrogenase [Octadecabacter sp. SW4]QEE36506.1 NADP-dependent phosphogluconate dehydrogenase [Octadecabacter sp. SW4]|tara:strand:- start:14 stop:1414 length:1401 start_codon:yes stop_codon:yes gene_type:complete
MGKSLANLGLYGLGTMGSALALNILDNGFALHVSNRTDSVVADFVDEAGNLAARLTPHNDLDQMARDMPSPRAIILMVPAGAPVDDAITRLIPLLDKGDTIIDAGNADFNDTRRRTETVEAAGLTFIGMGVSGGEEGARHGPSIMVGGTAQAWDAIRPMIDAIAAKFDGAPCADHLGPDGAGHFVKTVHNGIEYADMQLIAEVYGLMRYGAGRNPADIGKVFAAWDKGPLQSYLVEITGIVLQAVSGDKPAVDIIQDKAGQKGTGRWTVIEALKMGQSASTIEAAVAARGWSAEKETRSVGEGILGGHRGAVSLPDGDYEQALLAARIIAYAQGFRILSAASETYDWALDFARIAEIWRAGCIIRSALLDDISAAFRGDMPQGQLFLTPAFANTLKAAIPALRRVAGAAIAAGHPVPALTAALAFVDTMAQARGTTDLVQAQRDFFGRHGFEHIDGRKGQHGPWWD